MGPGGGSPPKAERQSRRGLRHLQSPCSWGRQLPHFGRPALSPSAAASVHLHHSWRRRVVPLKGRYRPQNCPRWCPLRLKWSRNPKRPPLVPLMGDLCFASQVWDLFPFQRWGKVGKLGAAAPPVFHHRWAPVPQRGGRVRLLRPQPRPAGSCSVPDAREWRRDFCSRRAPPNHSSASPRAPSRGSELGGKGA